MIWVKFYTDKKLTYQDAIKFAEKYPDNFGDAKEIINNPIHPYTKLLVNSIFPVKNKNWNIPDILIDEQKENNSFCKFYNRCNNKSKDCLNSDIKLQTLNKNHFVKCNNI